MGGDRRSDRGLVRAAWAGVALAVVTYGVTLASSVSRPHGMVVGDDPVADAVFGFVWLVFAATGAVVIRREPRNGVGWTFLAAGGLQIAYAASGEYAVWALMLRPGSLPLGGAAAWGAFNLSVLGLPALPLMLVWFPTGRPPSPAWRPVTWITTASAVVILAGAVLTWPHRGPAMLAEEPPAYPGEGATLVALMTVSGMLVAGAIALIVRFVRSSGVERQQLKLVALAASLVIAVIVLDLTGVLHEGSATVLDVLAAAAFASVPVASGVAIVRYRLFEIDRLISRTVSYAVIVAVLAGVYVAGILALSALVRWVAPAASDDLAVAGSTLAVAAAFGPLRRRVIATVDRRFNRGRYDADRILGGFGRRLRDEVELAVLDHELRAAVAGAVQPAGVSLWLPSRAGSP